jgi:hypothetical protein
MNHVYRKPMIETVSKEDTIKIPAEPPEGLIEMKEMKEMLDKYFANQVNSQGFQKKYFANQVQPGFPKKVFCQPGTARVSKNLLFFIEMKEMKEMLDKYFANQVQPGFSKTSSIVCLLVSPR